MLFSEAIIYNFVKATAKSYYFSKLAPSIS
jgi:hypothetical protein